MKDKKRKREPAPKERPAFAPAGIAKIRAGLGLTIEQAAAKVGITRRAWAQYEAGDRTPSKSMEILIAALRDGKI